MPAKKGQVLTMRGRHRHLVHLVRITCVFVAFLASTAINGCRREQPPKIVFTDFDVSVSTAASRPQYRRDFEKVLASLKESDVVVEDHITENPLAGSTPARIGMPENNVWKTNQMQYEASMRKAKDTARKAADDLLSEKRVTRSGSPPEHTRILDSLRIAERVLDGCGKHRKVLVIFSDGMEQSEDYDFTNMALNEEDVKRIIQTERDRGGLPDLSGVRVYIAGASAARIGGIPSKKILAVEDFWLRYLRACGADLSKNRYGSSLLQFDEP